ncbi:MAG: PIN domain-containing protein [Endomicrobia bacterium]|nr:PIN domain-containing protein [Endomicrobiia bacterium]
MKFYFDTNVIIAAFLTKGICFDMLVDAVLCHQGYFSEVLIKEVKKVLQKKKFSQKSIQLHLPTV